MSDLIPFEFNSKPVRIVADEHGNPWFCAKDVCDVLGYANDSQTVADHCKPDGVSKRYPIVDALGREHLLAYAESLNLPRVELTPPPPKAEWRNLTVTGHLKGEAAPKEYLLGRLGQFCEHEDQWCWYFIYEKFDLACVPFDTLRTLETIGLANWVQRRYYQPGRPPADSWLHVFKSKVEV